MTVQLKFPYFMMIATWCLALFWLSSQSEPPIPTDPLFSFPGADKIVHGALYAVLAGLVSFGIRRSNDDPAFSIQWYAPVGFAILYGMSDEWHQSFVPNRSPDGWDLLADGIGATFIQLVLYRVWNESPPDPDEYCS